MIRHKLRPIGVTAIISITFLLLTIPLNAKELEGDKQDKIAIVNGQTIAYADFEREFEIYHNIYKSKNPELPPAFVKQLRTQVVNEMVNQELLYQTSQKKKIKIDPEALEKEMADFRKKFPTKEQYQAWLKKIGFSEDGFKSQFYKRTAARNLLENEIISKINITQAEVKAFYGDNQEKFLQKEEVRARHILIKLDENADDKARANAREELTKIKEKLLAGEDFATLAKTHSQGPSNVKGGDLGYFTMDKMLKPFAQAAFKLKVNEVSGIVETRHGYHLIKVLDHKAARTPAFDEVKDKIGQHLKNERTQKDLGVYIEKLRKSAKIETFLKQQ